MFSNKHDDVMIIVLISQMSSFTNPLFEFLNISYCDVHAHVIT